MVLAIVLMVIGAIRVSAADEATAPLSPRSKAFSILASTYVTLNALDIYTTTSALRSGAGVEANPVVGPIAANPVALTALKAASTTATLVLAHRLWKHHRAGAITMLVVANIGMAVVVSHNAHVAGTF